MSEHMPTVLKALSDNTRFALFSLLLEHDLCVGALARRLQITEAAVSQHLQVLRSANLVTSERRGYYMHHQVNREVVLQMAGQLATMVKESKRQEKRRCGV